MDVFDRITQVLKEKGIKKSKLAKGTDIPYSTLSSMLSSHPKKVNYGVISRIAQFLGVETDFLFYGDEEYTKKLANLAFNPSRNQEEESKSFSDLIGIWQNSGERTIKYTNFILEQVYENGTKSSEKFSLYNSNPKSIVWTLYELIIKLAIEDNNQEKAVAQKLLEETRAELSLITPPYTEDMEEEIETLKQLISYYRKHISSLKVDIEKLNAKLNCWKTKSIYPI